MAATKESPYGVDPAPAHEHHEAAKRAAWLIFVLTVSILALVALVVRRIVPMGAEEERLFELFDHLTCAIFLIDFFFSLAVAKNRLRYLLTWGWLDLISSIPVAPGFRWARSARIVRILRTLRALRAARILTRALTGRRQENGLAVIALVVLVLLLFSSVAILEVEDGPNANIRTAEDAGWWALSTMTTVGYGDRFPVTTEGRMVAAVLMLGGVGIFGALSGLLASWFLRPTGREHETELQAVRRELAEIRALLHSMRDSAGGPAEPDRDDPG